MKYPSSKWILAGAVALAFAASNPMFGQGVTTSGLSGFVTKKDGSPVGGASVVAVYDPTGSRYTAITRSTGNYTISGLLPGGPYTVTATTPGLPPAESKGVYVTLGTVGTVDLTVETEVVSMEAFSVSETSTDTTFDSGSMGTGSSFSAHQIMTTSSVRRDLQDFQNLDPRAMVEQNSAGDPAYIFSVAGQNPRENALLVDGVSAADNFGLNSNGYAGLRNPVPLDWIASATLEVNPYDTIYSGFLGGITNVSLKSGSNTFHGSLYDIYTGTKFRGPDPVVGALGPHEPTQQHTIGATFSGPIIKDKLFFFLGYDTFRQIAAAPAQVFNPLLAPAGVTEIGQIATKLESGYTVNGTTYTYNPGALSGASHTWEQNFVGKLDWNISDSQKFTFTFRHTKGDAPVFYNYTSNTETDYTTSWYNSNRSDQSYTAQLNSDWSFIVPTLHTEIEATYKRYNGTASLNGPKLPAFTVGDISGYTSSTGSVVSSGSLFLGTYYAYQDNNIYTWEQEEHAYGDYSVGNHTFKFGAQFDRTGYTDTFIPNSIGSFYYSDVTNFLAGTPYNSYAETTAPGFTSLSQAVSHYYLLDIAPLLQDTWKPTSQLTVVGGVRMDYPYEPQKPINSTAFQSAFGFSNSISMGGNYTISPRLGFNYSFNTKLPTQLRGGAGLFLGQNPVVWIENSFNNAGQLATVTNGVASAAVPSEDYTDPKFHWPATWKENIAFDKTLPFLGIIATAEVDLSQVQKDVFYQQVNPYNTPASGPLNMPDGALRFAGAITPTGIGSAYYLPGYTTANFYVNPTSTVATLYQYGTKIGATYDLTNTTKGGSQEYTLMLNKPMSDNWAASIAYTHTYALQVDPFTSSTASGTFNGSAFVNPNDNVAYRSDYAVPDKVVITATRQFNFFKMANSTTSMSVQYITQTGQPYSYVFKGDADGSGISNEDSFYVPSGPNDPKVQWLSPTEEANFFTFLAQTPQLARFAGGIAPRNSAHASEQETLNLHFEQEIPVWGNVRMVGFVDCYNFANFFDKNWGIVSDFSNVSPYQAQTVAGTGYNKVTNQYQYVFNAGTLGSPSIYSDESRWQIQIGARIEF